MLKRHREAAHLTQEELAGRAGVGARTISNLERGVSKAPHWSTIRRLSEALRLTEGSASELAASVRHPAGQTPPGGRRPIEGGFLGATPTARLQAREGELGRVVDALRSAEGGSGRLVLLAGEPGIGKTRLAQEASVHAMKRRFVVAPGRCYEAQGGVPFYPFLDALGALYEEASPEDRGAISERYPYLVRLLPDHFPSQSAGFGESQEESQRLLRSVTRFVRDVSVERPVALLLDDLHCADGASVELLAHLARHTRGERVLLVGTYRDVEVDHRHTLRKAAQELSREHLVEEVRLGRLGCEETAALISDRLDGTKVSEEFAGLVYRHTDGNPFFTVEALKDLIERGDLVRRGGRWIRLESRDLSVPESVSEAISARVSRLPRKTRETLEGASVLGQEFGFEDLAAVLERGDEEVEGALEEAVSAGLVRTEVDHYGFDHALTQQTLYAGLSPARRKRLHLSAGGALERHQDRVRRRRASEVARHFVEGKTPARALPYTLLAGDAAGEVFAYAEAEHHYRSALELAGEVGDRPLAARALRSLGEALTPVGRYEEALTVLEEAANLAVELEDPEGEMRAVAQIGWAYAWTGRAEEEVVARLWILVGHDSSGDAPEPPGVSPRTLNLLRSALAALLFVARDYQRSIEVAQQTSALGRKLGDKRVVARAEIARGTALAFLRRPVEALEALEAAIPLAEETIPGDLGEAMPLAERANLDRNLADGMLMLDLLYTARGELDRSLEWAERGLTLAKRFDNLDMVASRSGRIGLNLFYRGEWKKARAHFERGTQIVRSHGPSPYSARLPGFLGILCIAEGSWGEAARLMEEATAVAERIRMPVLLHFAQAFQAQLDLARGRPHAALSRLEPLADVPDLNWTYAILQLTVLAQAHLELNDTAKAMALAERALREAEPMHNRLDAAEALRIKAMAQCRQGRRDEAASTLEEGLALVRPMPYPYAEARLSREYGMLHVRAGKPERARKRLSAAHEIFRRLGASEEVEQTWQTLRELGRA